MSKGLIPIKHLPFFYIESDTLFSKVEFIKSKNNIEGGIKKIYAENNECFGFVVGETTYCANERITELINIAIP